MKAEHKYKRDLDNVVAYQEYDDHGAWRKKPPKAAPPQPAGDFFSTAAKPGGPPHWSEKPVQESDHE